MEDASNDISSDVMFERYCRAQAFEHESFLETMVLNARIYPKWIKDTEFFLYRRKVRNSSGQGVSHEYRLVDAASACNTEAFDHSALASALSHAASVEIEPDNLPISEVTIDLQPLLVSFTAFDRRWCFDSTMDTCVLLSNTDVDGLVSPDRKKAVFIRDFNLWVRCLDSGEERALTTGGVRHFAYGLPPSRLTTIGLMAPEALWSPDSKKVITVQTDERSVLSIPKVTFVPRDGSIRPKNENLKYALPGDDHVASYRFVSINVETGRVSCADYPNVVDTVFMPPFFGKRVWWSKDNNIAYFIDMARGQKKASVIAFDTQSCSCQILFEEISESYIDLCYELESPAVFRYLADTNELIWFSERSGWGHLYLYDLTTGNLKNSITCGMWLVREVLYVDAKRREVIIQPAGRVLDRDPYYREIARVNIDTGALVVLASGDYDYVIPDPSAAISTQGDYIVATRTRVDSAPVTEVFSRESKLIMTLETADISGLPEGWTWPEPVKLLAADGKTDIYGVVFRPSDFSEDKQYPVLDWTNNNPFYAFVPKGAFGAQKFNGEGIYAYFSAAAFAELGFITVIIDGRGSSYRSKDFHDESYGRVETGSNLADHVAGIQELAERYPYMDLQRVGINDIASQAGVYGLLAYPEFYKAAFVQCTWDVRLHTLGEIYQGLPGRAGHTAEVLVNMAGNLKGKLLLAHGMLDGFSQMPGMLQIVDALVRENKDFDLVLMPNGGHVWDCDYCLRRGWDFLVTHLQGSSPPAEFPLVNGLQYSQEMDLSDWGWWNPVP